MYEHRCVMQLTFRGSRRFGRFIEASDCAGEFYSRAVYVLARETDGEKDSFGTFCRFIDYPSFPRNVTTYKYTAPCINHGINIDRWSVHARFHGYSLAYKLPDPDSPDLPCISPVIYSPFHVRKIYLRYI